MSRKNCRSSTVVLGGKKLEISGTDRKPVYMFVPYTNQWVQVTHRDQIKNLARELGRSVAVVGSTNPDATLQDIQTGLYNLDETVILSYTNGRGTEKQRVTYSDGRSSAATHKLDRLLTEKIVPGNPNYKEHRKQVLKAAEEYVLERSGFQEAGKPLGHTVTAHLKILVDKATSGSIRRRYSLQEPVIVLAEALRRNLLEAEAPYLIAQMGAFLSDNHASVAAPGIEDILGPQADTGTLHATLSNLSDKDLVEYIQFRSEPNNYGTQLYKELPEKASYTEFLAQDTNLSTFAELRLMYQMDVPAPNPAYALTEVNQFVEKTLHDPVVKEAFEKHFDNGFDMTELQFDYTPLTGAIRGEDTENLVNALYEAGMHREAAPETLLEVQKLAGLEANLTEEGAEKVGVMRGVGAVTLLRDALDSTRNNYNDTLQKVVEQDLVSVMHHGVTTNAYMKGTRELTYAYDLLAQLDDILDTPAENADLELVYALQSKVRTATKALDERRKGNRVAVPTAASSSEKLSVAVETALSEEAYEKQVQLLEAEAQTLLEDVDFYEEKLPIVTQSNRPRKQRETEPTSYLFDALQENRQTQTETEEKQKGVEFEIETLIAHTAYDVVAQNLLVYPQARAAYNNFVTLAYVHSNEIGHPFAQTQSNAVALFRDALRVRVRDQMGAITRRKLLRGVTTEFIHPNDIK